jgi:hypothetical protein
VGAEANRPGDWAEIEYNGNHGNNIQSAVRDLALQFGVMRGPGLPVNQGGLNWGKAITRTIYLWGEPQDELPSDRSTQVWGGYTTQEPCPPPTFPGCIVTTQHRAWLDTTISGGNGSYHSTGGMPQRVRFTRALPFLFFANLQGNNGAVPAPGCPGLPHNSSSAYGILPSLVVPNPSPGGGGGGTCSTWQPGGGVYTRQIDPESP